MLVTLISISLIVVFGLFLFSRRKSKFYPTPRLSGALPLLGNLLYFPLDELEFFTKCKSVSQESYKEGKNLTITLGLHEIIDQKSRYVPLGLSPCDIKIKKTFSCNFTGTYTFRVEHKNVIIYLAIGIVLTDPDDCETILNSQVEKNYLYSFAKLWIGDGLVTAPHSIWNKHRKIIYPMFNSQILNGYIDVFNHQARRLVSYFETEVGKGPFDHRRYLVLAGLETICQTALGVDIGDQNLTENKRYFEAIDGVMDGFVSRFTNIFWHNDFLFSWSSTKKALNENLKIIHGLSQKVINTKEKQYKQLSQSERFEEKSVKFRPIVDQLMPALEDKRLSHREVREQLDTLVATGYDTSAHELLYALMLLGTHQDVQDRAYNELEDLFGNTDRDVEKHDLSKMPYIEAVLKETLRLYPVTPVITRRNIEDIKIKHCTIPAGSNCFISIYGINHHPIWGPDVEEFKPERWLNPKLLPENPNAFAAFGLGKRSCIGKTYAMMSMKITLAHVLRHYRITSDVTKLLLKINPVLRPDSGQHISLELRK